YGHWVRGRHELLLIASKGTPPLPPTESMPASVIRERRREHSRKPEASCRIIEAMYPHPGQDRAICPPCAPMSVDLLVELRESKLRCAVNRDKQVKFAFFSALAISMWK